MKNGVVGVWWGQGIELLNREYPGAYHFPLPKLTRVLMLKMLYTSKICLQISYKSTKPTDIKKPTSL
jgi:hypothetical protein